MRRCRWRVGVSSSTTRLPGHPDDLLGNASRRTRFACFALGCSGIPEHRIRVIMRDTGGGFGQKIIVQRDEMCLMLAARKVPGPLKWVEDRRENLLVGRAVPPRAGHGVEMAFDAEGHIQAARHRLRRRTAAPTRRPGRSAPGAAGGIAVPRPLPGTARQLPRQIDLHQHASGGRSYRGPWLFETLAREMLLDIAARQMGMDPVELRRRTCCVRTTALHQPQRHDLRQHLPAGDLRAGAGDARLRRPSAASRQARRAGAGTWASACRTYVEPTTGGFGYYSTEAATIRIEPSGKVNVYVAGGSPGNSIETTVVQLTADALGVDIEDVTTIQGDTAVTGFGAGTGGQPQRAR